MLVTPLPGANRHDLRQTLRDLHEAAINIRARRAHTRRRSQGTGPRTSPRAPGRPSSACRAGDEAPLIVDPVRGEAVDVQALPPHLRRAGSTGVSLQANGGVCRGLLRERYATVGVGEEEIR